ncbi:hypothetical protein GCM10009123_09450 [Kangiella japonica]|uniref:SPOR domain-containing protein n=1 Tax=Kangiella japonica TaxID=647384 RepID=A0ABN0SWW2_9GAMM
MRHTNTKTLCLISLSVAVGLGGCVSNKGAPSLAEQDKQWFCVPQDSKEWVCEKDDTSFKQLAPPKSTEVESQWTVGEIPQDNSANEATLDIEDEGEGVNELSTPKLNNNRAQPVNSSIVSNPPSEPSLTEGSESSVSQESINDKGSSELQSIEISPWIVQLAAYSTKDAAERFVRRLGEGTVFKTLVKGKHYFTVALVGFDSKLDAERAAKVLKKRQLGVSPWVRTGTSFEKILSN